MIPQQKDKKFSWIVKLIKIEGRMFIARGLGKEEWGVAVQCE